MACVQVDVDTSRGGPRCEDAAWLGVHAAGGDVGNAAVGEGDPGLDRVFMATHQADAESLDGSDRGVDKCEDELEIVNHQVVDNTDVGRSECEGAQAFDPQVSGPIDLSKRGGDGGIESFDVAHLQDNVSPVGEVDQSGGVIKSSGDWLLDHHWQSGLQTVSSNGQVGRGRDGDGYGVDIAEQVMEVRDMGTSTRFGDRTPHLDILFGDTDQFDGVESGEDARVVSSEGTDAHDSDFQSSHAACRSLCSFLSSYAAPAAGDSCC